MGIGSTLQQLIESQGTNVNEVATATGVNPQTLYSLIKRDSTKANLDDLYKVAQHLGVSLDYFYSGYLSDMEPSTISNSDKESSMELWQILQQAMKEREYKVADVAHICELPDSTVRGIITRKQKSIALDVAFRLSRGLDIPLEVLAGEAAAKIEPPAGPEGQTGGERERLSAQQLEQMLIDFGYIQPGEDLSDQDFAFLSSMLQAIRAWFAKGK